MQSVLLFRWPGVAHDYYLNPPFFPILFGTRRLCNLLSLNKCCFPPAVHSPKVEADVLGFRGCGRQVRPQRAANLPTASTQAWSRILSGIDFLHTSTRPSFFFFLFRPLRIDLLL